MSSNVKVLVLIAGLVIIAGLPGTSLGQTEKSVPSGQTEKSVPFVLPREWFRLINNVTPEFMDELNLSPDQRNAILSICRQHSQKAWREDGALKLEWLLAEQQGIELTEEQKSEAQREIAIALNRETLERLSAVLIPFQLERLDQLTIHSIVNGREGFAQGIASLKETGLVDFGPGDLQNIENESQELQAEFEEKMFQLQQKYREQLLEELTDEQRERLEKLLGKPSQVGSYKLRF